MTGNEKIVRPTTLAEVARLSDSLSAFGMHLRDWQHAVQREGVHSRTALWHCIADEPPFCGGRFQGGDVADAYLAAYAEWLADRAVVARPVWTQDPVRVAQDPWFATPLRGWLLAHTPASFRQRNLFTSPQAIFKPAAGRPRVPLAQKREKARQRQKAYRGRIRALVQQARKDGGMAGA